MEDTINEIEQEYREKFVFYENIATNAIKWEDEELKNIAIKRLAGIKMMLEYMPKFRDKMINK